MPMTRSEHLQWAKDRALDLVDRGQISDAFASMASDLKSHPELEDHAAIELGVMMLVSGHLSSPHEMQKFIEGFN